MPRAVKIAGIVLLLWALTFVLPIAFVIEFPLILAFGWIFFLARVAKEVTINWNGVATAVVCLTLFTWGAHRFLSWFCRQLPNWGSSETKEPHRWRFDWTCLFVGSVVIMFIAGISMVGLAHQFAWMLASGKIIIWPDEAPRLVQSKSHLRNIGLALVEYHDVFRGLPIGATRDAQGQMLHGWQTAMLPYLEERQVYGAINQALRWEDRANHTAATRYVGEFLNGRIGDRTDAAGRALMHYTGNANVFDRIAPLAFGDMTDGRAHTILVGEIVADPSPWIKPGNWRDPALGINRSPMGFGCTWTAKGAQFLFADGEVKFIAETVEPGVFKAMGTPAAGDDDSEAPDPMSSEGRAEKP